MVQFHDYAALSADDLAGLYAYPDDGLVLRANMVTSADGAASAGGLSGGLSSAADRAVLALNRSLADVIVAGAGTVRAEGYQPVRVRELWRSLRSGRPATPPIAVISGSARLDPASPLISATPPEARTIVLTTAAADPARRAALRNAGADVVVTGDGDTVPAKAALAALRDRGHRRVLTEGGPAVLAQFAAAGLLDELCLTISPVLAGPGAGRILAGTPFPEPVPLLLEHLIGADGMLLCRYRTGGSPELPDQPVAGELLAGLRCFAQHRDKEQAGQLPHPDAERRRHRPGPEPQRLILTFYRQHHLIPAQASALHGDLHAGLPCRRVQLRSLRLRITRPPPSLIFTADPWIQVSRELRSHAYSRLP